jgi:DNA-binding transcriptional ArsR family regulator
MPYWRMLAEALLPRGLHGILYCGTCLRLQLLSWLRDPERNFPLEGAIADPAEVGVCVSHIQARIGLAQSTVSAYMADLERAGLVKSTRVGKWAHYKRDEQHVAEFIALLGRTL